MSVSPLSRGTGTCERAAAVPQPVDCQPPVGADRDPLLPGCGIRSGRAEVAVTAAGDGGAGFAISTELSGHHAVISARGELDILAGAQLSALFDLVVGGRLHVGHPRSE